jgi:hypothetical protein
MDYKNHIIETLFNSFKEIRYAALYLNDELAFRQKVQTADSSSADTDKYEELLVNPVLLKAASQRGNIDCGGLDYLVVAYGNFFQLVSEVKGGHISICLDKKTDLTNLPDQIFSLLKTKHSELF